MTTATNRLKNNRRDWNVDGVPGSLEFEPLKSEDRAAYDLLGEEIVAAATGQNPKTPVVAASTVNVTIASVLVNGGTLDGVTLAAGDDALLKDQTDQKTNGKYTIAASGPPSRSTDLDSGSEFLGAQIYVNGGTTNAGRIYICSNTSAPVLGTDNILFDLYQDLSTFFFEQIQPLVDAAELAADAAELAAAGTPNAASLGQAWAGAFRSWLSKLNYRSLNTSSLLQAIAAALRATQNDQGIRIAAIEAGETNVVDDQVRFALTQASAHHANSGQVAREETVSTKQQIAIYDNTGTRTVVSEGTKNYVAPQLTSLGIINCLSDRDGSYEPFTILGGRIVKRDNVVIGKAKTGQSLGLESRGYVLDPAGPYSFDPPDGVGRLFVPTPVAGYGGYCLALAGGPRAISWAGSSAYINIHDYADAVTGGGGAPVWTWAMRDWDQRYIGMDARWVYSISALGGVPYASIKKGTTTYTNMISMIAKQQSIAVAAGWDYILPTIDVEHGESEASATILGYAASLSEWISDYKADLLSGYGITVDMLMVTQVTSTDATTREVPLAQLYAHENDPAVCLVGPKYDVPYFDQYHTLAQGYADTSVRRARADRFALAGIKWQPLKPVTIAYNSGTNTITITTNTIAGGNDNTPGPIGRLSIDTAKVASIANYGFEVSAAGPATISSVSLSYDGASIIIALSGTPDAGAIIRYAMQDSGAYPSNGHRGNIRDNDRRDTSYFNGQYLENWLVAFEEVFN